MYCLTFKNTKGSYADIVITQSYIDIAGMLEYLHERGFDAFITKLD